MAKLKARRSEELATKTSSESDAAAIGLAQRDSTIVARVAAYEKNISDLRDWITQPWPTLF